VAKVAVTLVLMGTAAALDTGDTLVTVGGVASELV